MNNLDYLYDNYDSNTNTHTKDAKLLVSDLMTVKGDSSVISSLIYTTKNAYENDCTRREQLWENLDNADKIFHNAEDLRADINKNVFLPLLENNKITKNLHGVLLSTMNNWNNSHCSVIHAGFFFDFNEFKNIVVSEINEGTQEKEIIQFCSRLSTIALAVQLYTIAFGATDVDNDTKFNAKDMINQVLQIPYNININIPHLKQYNILDIKTGKKSLIPDDPDCYYRYPTQEEQRDIANYTDNNEKNKGTIKYPCIFIEFATLWFFNRYKNQVVDPKSGRAHLSLPIINSEFKALDAPNKGLWVDYSRLLQNTIAEAHTPKETARLR